MTFIMAGGGTGGHVIPGIAVARELETRGHRPVFIGTQTGFEAKLVPQAGFLLEFIQIGGLNRVGMGRAFRTLSQLPSGLNRVLGIFDRHRPSAVFSMGGYVAGPVVLAAWWRGIPLIVMEPNAIPGLTNRRVARFVRRALLSFPEAAKYFPRGRSEITGLPVRRAFFDLPVKSPGPVLTILITGGSRGSRTLNESTRDSWSYFRKAAFRVRLLHQTGAEGYECIAKDFGDSSIEGEVMPFIPDMPAAFAEADLIICRSGAGAVAELGAAGKPAILVPFPYAADQHQLKNAEALTRIGAATLVLDKDMSGRRLFDEVARLSSEPGKLESMGKQARTFSKPHAAHRAAELLEEVTDGRN